MKKYVVNVSSDKLYFSRCINLIGSIKKNCSDAIGVIVWDLGMTPFQLYILNIIGIEVKKIPNFIEYWNLCYTWKIYVYKNSIDPIFFHLDAGNIVKKDLVHIFTEIECNDYFLIDQGQLLGDIIPKSYYPDFECFPDVNSNVFAAGNIGLNKNNSLIKNVIDEAYQAALNGYCLGYSKSEEFRDLENMKIRRDCKLFRHDQSVINLLMRKHFSSLKLNKHENYASINDNASTYIYNKRTYSYEYVFFVSQKIVSIPIYIYCVCYDFYNRVTKKLKKVLR